MSPGHQRAMLEADPLPVFEAGLQLHPRKPEIKQDPNEDPRAAAF